MRKFLSLLTNTMIWFTMAVICSNLFLRFSADGAVHFDPEGLNELKYFTTISNLLAGSCSFLFVIFLQLKLCGIIKSIPAAIRIPKYCACAALALTMTVTAGYLLPRLGYERAYGGEKFWLHIILPLAAIIDHCVLDREGGLKPKQMWYALILPVGYCIGYSANLFLNGFGKNNRNDWYRFGETGPFGLIMVMILLMLLTSVFAFILQRIREEKYEKPAVKGGRRKK